MQALQSILDLFLGAHTPGLGLGCILGGRKGKRYLERDWTVSTLKRIRCSACLECLGRGIDVLLLWGIRSRGAGRRERMN